MRMLIFCWLCLIGHSHAIAMPDSLAIIPQPYRIQRQAGGCTIDKHFSIVVDEQVKQATANYLKNYLHQYCGLVLTASAKLGKKSIWLKLLHQHELKEDVYELTVGYNSIVVASASQAGLFYGIQTLIQLMPTKANASVVVPCLSIEDYPRFGYRGMHLDVSRHFFSVGTIKRCMDQMAWHKLNYFHLHLTDNETWRLAIKGYPALTRGIPHYSQNDVRQLVKYAKERFITIVPEIDVPGHCGALLRAYPEFGAFSDTGKNVLQPSTKTFQFLKKVLAQVATEFPGSYVHIGGDEVDTLQWANDPLSKKFMAQENLSKSKLLTNYFAKKMAEYLNVNGKKAIGWDELLEGPLDSSITIMCWRSANAGLFAARNGHDVIMTPYKNCYFDFAQNQPEDSITVKMYLPLKKVYQFDPMPAGLEPSLQHHILGGQANVWTENIGTREKLDYMVFPRLAAMSEALWSQPSQKDWDVFREKMTKEYERYKLWRINYCKSTIHP